MSGDASRTIAREAWRERQARLVVLHARVLRGQGAAAGAMAEALAAILRSALQWARGRHHPDVIEMAIDDSIQAYLAAPARYDATRGSLVGWLLANVSNRLVDAGRARSRRRKHEVPSGVDLVRLGARLDARDSRQAREGWIVRRGLALLRVARTAEERAFVRMLVAGEPRESWAAALGASHLPAAEQSAAVRRACARLRKRLARRDERWREDAAVPGRVRGS